MTVTEKIEITAGTIRSIARENGENPKELTEKQAADYAEHQAHIAPNTIAAKFYLEATERQWTRIYNKVIGGR